MGKFITPGIKNTFPLSLTLFMWNVHANMKDRDYLTVFEFKTEGNVLTIEHRQEVPEYKKIYTLETDEEINTTVFIVDQDYGDKEISTMMLGSEY